jgi:G:T-mismatch repair DNA endonuclease (very short patch repair protein)
MKYLNICLNCGKEYYSHPSTKRKFCSHECYTISITGKKCPSKGRKGKRGKYSDYQITKMVESKKEAQLQRWIHLFPTNIEQRLKEILDLNYVSGLDILTNHLLIENFQGHHSIPSKVIKKLLIKNNYYEKFLATPKYPEGIQKMNTEVYKDFLVKIQTCSYEDIKYWAINTFNMNIESFNRTFKKFFLQTKDIFNYFDKDIKVLKINGKLVKRKFIQKYTLPEKVFEMLLKDLKLEYKTQYAIPSQKRGGVFHYDFFIDNKLFVEINGDYWHGFNKECLNTNQMKVIEKDLRKIQLAADLGVKCLTFWEHDLVTRHGKVKDLTPIVNILENELKEATNE